MPKSKAVLSDLSEFAAAIKAARKPPCLLCTIPQRAEVEKTYLSGAASQPIIRQWLISKHGHAPSQLTKSKIEDHFMHHVKQPLKCKKAA